MMMKRLTDFLKTCLLLLLAITVSCRPVPEKEPQPIYTFQQSFHPSIEAVVDSFTARYPATYTELHINKVCGARVFFALLYSGESPLSTVPACIKASTFDGTVVSVYSGLEDVCVRHDSLPPVHVDEQLIRKGHFWLIKHDWRNVLQVREADARLRSPFVPTQGFISADELNTHIMMDSIKRYDDLHHRGIIY